MTTVREQMEMRDKILVEKAYEKLLEYKRQKNSYLVVIRDNKIVKIKP